MVSRPVVVLDVGTGYTKLGFAGNLQPSFSIPTCIATKDKAAAEHKLDDLDFLVGNEACQAPSPYCAHYPVQDGLVKDWDHTEKFLQQCIFQYLRVNPEDHHFVLTELPLNPAENQEFMAEIMFETFNVAGLYTGIQPVLALYGSHSVLEKQQAGLGSLTGLVVDCGEGTTHVVPVVDGYVLGSSIKAMPIAGKDVSRYVQRLLRERSRPEPADVPLDIARQVKELYCYVCSDTALEGAKYGQDARKFKTFESYDVTTNKVSGITVGHERYLGPEVLFNPELLSSAHTATLPKVVDEAIQSCPIDTRRALYSNIVLSGGSTMFRSFGKRLQADLAHIIGRRTAAGARAIDVSVQSFGLQKYAVWFGASVLAMAPDFPQACQTREQYQEYGTCICRDKYVFKATL